MYQLATGGRPANRPPNRAAGGWSAWQAPVWRPVSSNALLDGAPPWQRPMLLRAFFSDAFSRLTFNPGDAAHVLSPRERRFQPGTRLWRQRGALTQTAHT